MANVSFYIEHFISLESPLSSDLSQNWKRNEIDVKTFEKIGGGRGFSKTMIISNLPRWDGVVVLKDIKNWANYDKVKLKGQSF